MPPCCAISRSSSGEASFSMRRSGEVSRWLGRDRLPAGCCSRSSVRRRFSCCTFSMVKSRMPYSWSPYSECSIARRANDAPARLRALRAAVCSQTAALVDSLTLPAGLTAAPTATLGVSPSRSTFTEDRRQRVRT